MSYISKKFWNITCDRCGELMNDDMWKSKDVLEDDLEDYEFIEHNGKHYCSGCYYIDDDDNIQIKPPKQ